MICRIAMVLCAPCALFFVIAYSVNSVEATLQTGK